MELSSCRFDSFIFLFTYCIITYLKEPENGDFVNDEFVKFIKALVKAL